LLVTAGAGGRFRRKGRDATSGHDCSRGCRSARANGGRVDAGMFASIEWSLRCLPRWRFHRSTSVWQPNLTAMHWPGIVFIGSGGDDRFVPHNDPRINFDMTKRLLLDRVPLPRATCTRYLRTSKTSRRPHA
jgi:hypothetical protein